MPRSCVKISDTVVFGIPRSASSSHTVSCQSLLIAAHTHSTFSGVWLVAGFPEHGSLSADFQPFLQHLYNTFICTTFTASSPKAFWINWIVSTEECSSLMQNLMQSHRSTSSFILNTMATQYTCSLNSDYRPQVPWSRHCSCMRKKKCVGPRINSVDTSLMNFDKILTTVVLDSICRMH